MATESGARERILERIRAGLRVPVHQPESTAATGTIFAPVENPLARFQQEAKANLMECFLTNSSAETAQQIAKILATLPDGEIYIQDDPALKAILQATQTSRPIRWSSEGAPREQSQATVTLVEAFIAQTGSIFVSASCGGRGASVVPPCHIAVGRKSQLVPDLQTALGNAARQGILERNSFACVISGSSRTADIEKILVQGAHGPIRLVVIVEMDS